MKIKLTTPQCLLLLVIVLDFTVAGVSMAADLSNGAQPHDMISRYAFTGLFHGGLMSVILIVWLGMTNGGGGGRTLAPRLEKSHRLAARKTRLN